MKTGLQCFECFTRMAASLTEKVSDDRDFQLEIMRAVCTELAQSDFTKSTPVIARNIFSVIQEKTGLNDPFSEEKRLSTRYAKEIAESVRNRIHTFPDRFDALLRLAISGNIIDFGVNARFNLENACSRIAEALNETLDPAASRLLKQKMEEAPAILYLLDNCGEAVFDRMFLEPYRHKTTLVVRGKPVLNDITRKELAESGLEHFAHNVVDTGDFTPGIDLEASSPEFLREFFTAPLIIAKGQGNYETLTDTDRPVFFLFRAKCPVVIREAGNVPPLSMQIIAKNIQESP